MSSVNAKPVVVPVPVEKRFMQLVLAFIVAVLTMVSPMLGVLAVFTMAGIAALYYAAIAGGLYKEPLLSEFRQYGNEPTICPLGNALLAAGVWCLTLTMVVPLLVMPGSFFARLLPSIVFSVLGIILLGASITVYRQPHLRSSLPIWYAQLLKDASRQERRHIGWAWLRLPWRMRIRLNGDNKAFSVWAELVRLTVIYGAYDPDSPWHRWT